MVRGRVAGDSVSDVGPASVMVGNIVQGNRLASAQGRDMGVLDEDSDNAKKVCEFEKKLLFKYIIPFFFNSIVSLCYTFCFALSCSISLSRRFYDGELSARRTM